MTPGAKERWNERLGRGAPLAVLVVGILDQAVFDGSLREHQPEKSDDSKGWIQRLVLRIEETADRYRAPF